MMKTTLRVLLLLVLGGPVSSSRVGRHALRSEDAHPAVELRAEARSPGLGPGAAQDDAAESLTAAGRRALAGWRAATPAREDDAAEGLTAAGRRALAGWRAVLLGVGSSDEPGGEKSASGGKSSGSSSGGGGSSSPSSGGSGSGGSPGGGVYFRDVSVTVRCVIFLTSVAMVIYTMLSISRNADELAGESSPTPFTQILTVASRSIALSPMICMLFVGCRMYVLATTEGLGEPQDWVKTCMYVVCGGLSLQLLVVFLFSKAAQPEPEKSPEPVVPPQELTDEQWARSVATRASSSGRLSEQAAAANNEPETDVVQFHDTVGEQNDAHPNLRKAKYGKEEVVLRPSVWILQVISMGCIYVGVAGVIAGICIYPRGATKISAAVTCTIVLSAAYFLAFFFLWVARTLPDAADGGQNMLVNAGLAMCSSMRKAPMFAVLFLAARMRALNLDPPLGMPPFWLQCCFYSVTGLLMLEALLAAVVGLTGTPHKAYYGVNVFHSKLKGLQIVAHICALLTFVVLIPIFYGVYMMTDQRENIGSAPNPGFEERGALSTTLHCVLIYEVAYFSVIAGQTLTLLMQDVKSVECPNALDTFVAAGISLGLAPMFCILFVATRMRALQITQQMGAPPGWTQDCMYICVFATCLQATCCLVMPIFIGGACKTDEDGNPDYDLTPMVGAYAVTVVKYVAMLSLYGGLIMIGAAIFLMDEKSCMDWKNNRMINSYTELFEALFIAAIVFFIALMFSSAKVIGLAVKTAIEAADQAFLGVDIEIHSAALNLCKGYIKVEKLKVCQPEFETIWARDENGNMTGTKTMPEVKLDWKEDYIFKVKTLLIKVNLWRLATSLGKEFELENLTLTGIKVNFEKPNADLRKSDSNVEYVINYIDSLGLIPPLDAAPAQPEPKPAPKKDDRGKKSWKEDPLGLKTLRAQLDEVPRVILKKIEVGDVGATVLMRNVRVLRGRDVRFAPSIGILAFPNIQRDVFGGREDLSPQETIACVVKALGKKLFTSIGKELPTMIKEKVKDNAGAALKRISSMGDARSGAACCRRRQDAPSPGVSAPASPPPAPRPGGDLA